MSNCPNIECIGKEPYTPIKITYISFKPDYDNDNKVQLFENIVKIKNASEDKDLTEELGKIEEIYNQIYTKYYSQVNCNKNTT